MGNAVLAVTGAMARIAVPGARIGITIRGTRTVTLASGSPVIFRILRIIMSRHYYHVI